MAIDSKPIPSQVTQYTDAMALAAAVAGGLVDATEALAAAVAGGLVDATGALAAAVAGGLVDATGAVAATETALQATQVEIEARSNVNRFIPPDLLQKHPGVAKAFASVSAGGLLNDTPYNLASLTDNGVGDRTLVWDTDFSTATYKLTYGWSEIVGASAYAYFDASTALVGSANLLVSSDIGTYVVAFGDQ